MTSTQCSRASAQRVSRHHLCSGKACRAVAQRPRGRGAPLSSSALSPAPFPLSAQSGSVFCGQQQRQKEMERSRGLTVRAGKEGSAPWCLDPETFGEVRGRLCTSPPSTPRFQPRMEEGSPDHQMLRPTRRSHRRTRASPSRGQMAFMSQQTAAWGSQAHKPIIACRPPSPLTSPSLSDHHTVSPFSPALSISLLACPQGAPPLPPRAGHPEGRLSLFLPRHLGFWVQQGSSVP